MNPGDSVFSDTLQDVVISAELTKRKGMQDIITVTKQMRENTHNAGELLGKITGIEYNPIDKGIKYFGSSNIIILVDSVEKDVTYIKNLKPERFGRVSIINSPVGKYSGYDAVISLHTIPVYQGYEGNADGEITAAPGNRYGKGNNLHDMLYHFDYTHTRGKFNVAVVASWGWHRKAYSNYTSELYPLNDYRISTLTAPYSKPATRSLNANGKAEVSVDYDINTKHSISGKVVVNTSWLHEDTHFDYEREYLNTGESDVISQDVRNGVKDRLGMQAGIWYRGNVKNWRLDANMNYNIYNFKSLYGLTQSSGLSIFDNRKIKSNYWGGSATASTYSTNEKWQFMLTDYFFNTHYKAYREGTGDMLSSTYDFRNSGQASVMYFPNRRLSVGVNAGASLLHTSDGAKSKNYVSPLLGAQAAWYASKALVARFNYTMQMGYPSLSAVQNYGQFTDSLKWIGGNPDLKPALMHDASLSLSFFDLVTLKAMYSHTKDGLFEDTQAAYGLIPSAGIEGPYARTIVNNCSQDYWSINATFQKSFGSHWYMSLDGKVRGVKAKSQSNSNSRILPGFTVLGIYNAFNGTLMAGCVLAL